MLVVALTPEKVIIPVEKGLLPRPLRNLKKPFAMMSIYILSVFGTQVFCNFRSALN